MRNVSMFGGGLVALLVSTAQAPAQESRLTGLLDGFSPEIRLSWETGALRGDTEIYEGLFAGWGNVRVRADEVRITPDGARVRIDAERVIVNLDREVAVVLELAEVETSLPAGLLGEAPVGGAIPDLCLLGAAGAEIDAVGIRVVRGVPDGEGGRVRSETRVAGLSLSQEVRSAGPGCELVVTASMEEAQEDRSDKSGFRVDLAEAGLALPGNVETLASGRAPDLSLTASFSGALRQVPGGATVASVREGDLSWRLTALSAVPALTAHLRTRDAAFGDRVLAITRALHDADTGVSLSLRGTTLLAEALIPADLISGLSRASLSSVIGDYEADLVARSGVMTARAGTSLVGIGESGIEATARITPREGDPSDLGVAPRLAALIPRTDLDLVLIRHRDAGLLRAIELISGFPVSVMAAIFLEDGLDAVAAPWRPAARRAAAESARFLALSTRDQGAELELRTPTDLSVLETYRLMTLRPDLWDKLISVEVRPAAPE